MRTNIFTPNKWVPIKCVKIFPERERILSIRKRYSKIFKQYRLEIVLETGDRFYYTLMANPGKTDRRRMYYVILRNEKTGNEITKLSFKKIKITQDIED